MMTPLEALEQFCPERLILTDKPETQQLSSSDEATAAPSESAESEENDLEDDEDEKAPRDFICPLTLQVMRDPVLSRYGQNYERHAILEWLTLHKNCPLTRRPLEMRGLIANHNLRLKIRKWELENDYDIKLVMDVPSDGNDPDGPHNARIYGYIDLNDEAEHIDDDPTLILEYRGEISTSQSPTSSRSSSRRRRPRGFLARIRRAVVSRP